MHHTADTNEPLEVGYVYYYPFNHSVLMLRFIGYFQDYEVTVARFTRIDGTSWEHVSTPVYESLGNATLEVRNNIQSNISRLQRVMDNIPVL